IASAVAAPADPRVWPGLLAASQACSSETLHVNADRPQLRPIAELPALVVPALLQFPMFLGSSRSVSVREVLESYWQSAHKTRHSPGDRSASPGKMRSVLGLAER